jgi:hypothetical protein
VGIGLAKDEECDFNGDYAANELRLERWHADSCCTVSLFQPFRENFKESTALFTPSEPIIPKNPIVPSAMNRKDR